MKLYRVQAKGAKSAEIFIYEEIGGYWGGVSAKQFAKDLKDLGDIENISLRINSPGGEVFDGFAIYNLLKQHKARVSVSIDGIAASIASVIAMAGDEILIADNAMMMIHKAWGLVAGNADTMREVAAKFDKLDESLTGTYVKRTSQDEQKIKDMLAAETWMTAKEALANGFVDKIVDAVEAEDRFDLTRFSYRNIPKDLMAVDQRARIARMNLVAQKLRSASAPK